MDTTPPSLSEALAHIATNRGGPAWSILVQIASAPVLTLACRLTGDSDLADDVLQETLLAVLEHAPRFQVCADPDRDALRWILALAAHRSLRLRRDRMRSRRRDERAARRDLATPPIAADEALSLSERHQRLHDALGALDEPWRTALTLRYLAELGYDDIANSMRVPVGTAKTHVHRGLERLRRCLPGGCEAWSGVALAELAQAAGNPPLPGAAVRLRSWRRSALTDGSALAATASAVATGCLMVLVCVGAEAGDAPLSTASAATPLEAPPGDPAPLLQLVPQDVESSWSLSMPSQSDPQGTPPTTQSSLSLGLALSARPAAGVAGYRLTITEARTDTGELLSSEDAVEGRLEDQVVTLHFSAPPLGARRLSLRGTLAVDLDDAPPRVLDIAPLSAAAGRWFSCAQHPDWLFQLTASNGGCDLLMTSAMLRALGTPSYSDDAGRALPISGTNSGTTRGYTGQVMALRGFYAETSPHGLRLSLPLHDTVHTVSIPVVLDGIPLAGVLWERHPSLPSSMADATPVPSAGVLPCRASPGPAPGDATRPLTLLQYSGFTASVRLWPPQQLRPAVPRATAPALAATADGHGTATWSQFGGYELHFRVPGGQPGRILAVDEALVTSARTDAGEDLVGLPRGANARRTLVDSTFSQSDDFSISAATELPRRSARTISRLQGLLLAEAATAPPSHLRLEHLQSHLGRWLSAPGDAVCMLRATLLAKNQFGTAVQTLRIERTPEMALVMRGLSVRDAAGSIIANAGIGSGDSADGSDYLDISFTSLPADAMLEADLFLAHAPVEEPFMAADLTIAVPAPATRTLRTERLPAAALTPTVLSLRDRAAAFAPVLAPPASAAAPSPPRPPAGF
jgi:RNA polymerase sigma-70 factor (ECF subfamily)